MNLFENVLCYVQVHVMEQVKSLISSADFHMMLQFCNNHNSKNFLSKLISFHCWTNTPQNYSLPQSRVETGEINSFDSVTVADTEHPPNCKTCSTFNLYDSSNLCGYQFVKQKILLFSISSTYFSL